jgi:hypothetical protein
VNTLAHRSHIVARWVSRNATRRSPREFVRRAVTIATADLGDTFEAHLVEDEFAMLWVDHPNSRAKRMGELPALGGTQNRMAQRVRVTRRAGGSAPRDSSNAVCRSPKCATWSGIRRRRAVRRGPYLTPFYGYMRGADPTCRSVPPRLLAYFLPTMEQRYTSSVSTKWISGSDPAAACSI